MVGGSNPPEVAEHSWETNASSAIFTVMSTIKITRGALRQMIKEAMALDPIGVPDKKRVANGVTVDEMQAYAQHQDCLFFPDVEAYEDALDEEVWSLWSSQFRGAEHDFIRGIITDEHLRVMYVLLNMSLYENVAYMEDEGVVPMFRPVRRLRAATRLELGPPRVR